MLRWQTAWERRLVWRNGGLIVIVLALAFQVASAARAQGAVNLAARLRVLAPGVEVQRVRTSAWLPVRVETLVSVGDGVRTVGAGRAQIAFGDGVLLFTLQPQSTAYIAEAQIAGDVQTVGFRLESGFARQQTLRTLDAETRYYLRTPAFEGLLLAGQADFRVEADGRSAALLSEGAALKVQNGRGSADLTELRTGVRAATNEAFSDVVTATSFPALDIALDGCPSVIRFEGDYLLNVRLGASTDYPVVGAISNDTPIQAMGVAASGGWYRLRFSGGFAWVRVSRLPLPPECTALRIFPDAFGPEPLSAFTGLTTPPPPGTAIAPLATARPATATARP
jgi:hypothetical protein